MNDMEKRELGFYWVKRIETEDVYIAEYSYMEGNKYTDGVVTIEREYGWLRPMSGIDYTGDDAQLPEAEFEVLSDRLTHPEE